MNVHERGRDPSLKNHIDVDIIDCDVHPVIRGGVKGLLPYVPEAWRHRFELKLGHLAAAAPLTMRYEHPSGSAIRTDASPSEGAPGGSDPDFVIKDLIEGHGINCAVLNSLQAGQFAVALAGPDESIVLCSAANDYFIEEWGLISTGPLRLAMSVPTQDPDAAAAEIRRLAPNGAVACISLPLLNILMGNRWYYPIYEAAQEQGLSILVHLTGAESIYKGAPASAAGWTENYPERYVSLAQIGQANLTSLMFSGTFEKFPDLKFLFVEYGFTWILSHIWRMDKTWQSMRYDVPWVKKPPGEYIHERVRFSTQPLDEPEDPKQLYTMIDMIGDDVLMYSSDYPHWDNDMPGQSLIGLSKESKRRIFRENALAALRL